MLKADQINEIHRLAGGEHWSMRRIARHLHLAARTVKKYLWTPVPEPVRRPRPSKLDPFKPLIADLLEQDPRAPGVVILQRLQAAGYAGCYSLLRQYLRRVRVARSAPRAFVRMEPAPGERFEIDWGHFGSLDYQGDQRKLYAFSLIEAHSRMLYVEFTHSQSFETFVRCHQHAFRALGGVARECWYDNLLTAVAEHDGRLVRFNPRFLAFAREYGFYPRACNPRAGWEKGKIEKGGIAYLRSNFWPYALSPISRMSTARCGSGWMKSPTCAFIEKPVNVPAIVSGPTACGRCRRWLPITATPPKSWSTKTCAGISMAIATALRPAWSDGASSSRRMRLPSPSMIWKELKSSVMHVPGGVARPSAPSASKRNCSPVAPPPGVPRPNNG